MELDYDSTDIQIVDISKSEDIINNYDKTPSTFRPRKLIKVIRFKSI